MKPLDRQRFDLIIFDLDGVLVASSPCHARAYAELWARVGVEGPSYDAIAGQRTVEAVEHVCGPLALSAREIDELVRFKQERARQCLASQPIVFPDVLPALARLAPRHRFAVGTGASQTTAELMLREVDGHFETVVTAADVRQGKPHPEVYQTVLARCCVEPERAVVIEDSTSGLLAAIAAGAHAVVVRGEARSDSPLFHGRFPNLTSLADAMGIMK